MWVSGLPYFSDRIPYLSDRFLFCRGLGVSPRILALFNS